MPLTLSDIIAARTRIAPYIRNTDLIPLWMPGQKQTLSIKAENMQLTGSFKVRGAANKILQLSDEEKSKGVIAASAGNHAQGVARMAREVGVACTIVMPRTAPLAKIAATEGYGATVVLFGDTYDDAYEHALSLQESTGAVFVHAFADPAVIAGQGTIALELFEQMPTIDQILVPIGGGGLLAGIALCIKTMRPDVKVIGVEAANAASMHASICQNQVVTVPSAKTMADGIAVKTPAQLTYELCKEYVDEIVMVEEDDIASTILYLLEEAKIIAEGAGAAAIAAAYCDRVSLTPNTAAILSGGNIDVNFIARIIQRGLLNSGRKFRLVLTLHDRPGELARLSALVADTGANVVAIHHDRTTLKASIDSILVDIEMETKDRQQGDDIIQMLIDHGYNLLPQ